MTKSVVKACSLTAEVPLKLIILSTAEVVGMYHVAVKCVEIGKNTDGEGTLLGYY